jgi:Bifunctional DNA primase/polymerase, N-terminal
MTQKESNTPTLPNTINESADFWRYDIGVNVIPADTKNKTPSVPWSEFQNNPIPEELHNRWKSEGTYLKGIAIIPGRVWHRKDKQNLYFTFIDADKNKAIEELCNREEKAISLQEMAQKFLVEQHKDSLTEKAHIYMYSSIPFPQKSADSVLGLEIKGLGEHGIAFCFPSIHKDGLPYEIIGTNQPITLNEDQSNEMILHIDNICKKYGLEYLEKHYRRLLDSDCKIYKGSRHDSLLRIANSLLFRDLGGNEKSRSELEIKAILLKINNTRCVPSPLPTEEIDKIWDDAVNYVRQIKAQQDEDRVADNDPSKGTIAQKALELAILQCSELFLDQFGSPYAAVKIGEHTETLPLKSVRFKNWLCKEFYESEDKILNSESVTNVLNVLKARAEFGGIARELYLRVANDSNDPYTIYYDLTNKDWETIRIMGSGWNIENAPTVFRRYSNQQPQVYPTKDYQENIFDKFVRLINVKDEDNKLLLKCYIVTLFIPNIPKPVLMLHGEQGSAKTTLQELIKMLVDPSPIKTVTFPRDITELVQKLMHNYVCYFDNISIVPGWISDQLCRAVTGSGFSKRELYSDDEDIIYSFKRCIGFNGINLGATKADLLDRGIIIELQRISKEKMRKLEEIWQVFDSIRPNLLGYIFDVLAQVIQIRKNGGIKINGFPRMADFAETAEIISRCMGNKENKFLDIYYNNIELLVEEAIEAHPVGIAIIKFMEDRTEWAGTTTELLAELEGIANQLKIDTRDKLWAKAPNVLSRRINEVKTNLRELGMIIERNIEDSKTNIKTLKIRKVSLESLVSFDDKNQSQNQPEFSNDIMGIQTILSLEHKVSLEDQSQNHAQHSIYSDTNDTNDILHTSSESCEEKENKTTIVERVGENNDDAVTGRTITSRKVTPVSNQKCNLSE